MSCLASPPHAPLACRSMQMVNHITLCISLGGRLDNTDLSLPSGVGSSPAGKSSRRDILALCSSAQSASCLARKPDRCVSICDWSEPVVPIVDQRCLCWTFLCMRRELKCCSSPLRKRIMCLLDAWVADGKWLRGIHKVWCLRLKLNRGVTGQLAAQPTDE